MGELLQLALEQVRGSGAGGLDERVEAGATRRERGGGAVARPGRGLGEGPQALAAGVLGGALQVTQGELAGGLAFGTCPEAQAHAHAQFIPRGVAGVDAGERGLGAEAVAFGGEGKGEVGAGGAGGGVGLGALGRLGLAAQPGDRLVDALGRERDLGALGEQELTQRATGALGQAGAGLVQLEQRALVTATAALREGGEQVVDEAGLRLQRPGELVDELASAAQCIEAGVELAAEQVQRGLDERAGGVTFAALAEALGEQVQDIGAVGHDQTLLDDRQGDAEQQARVAGAGLELGLQALVGGRELSGATQVVGLTERAQYLFGLLRPGGFGDGLADALGPAAERTAD